MARNKWDPDILYYLLPSPALSLIVKIRDLMIRQRDMSSPKVDGTHSLLFPNAPVYECAHNKRYIQVES